MTAPRIIPIAVTERQTEASNPDYSAWVSANAGSGKTHVLTQRVIRLLLSGVEPARILCITFTKAAAANMANRVFADLRAWTALDDEALDEAMRKIGVKKIDAAQRARARQLFALALETPGGLKVQTIHAFCTQLLHLFPFEANVPARFEVLDEITETQMLGELTLAVLLEAAETPDSALGRALAQAVLAAADVTVQDMVREAIRERDPLTRWVDQAGGVDRAMAQLSAALGVRPDETAADVEAAIFKDSRIGKKEWTAVAATLAQGSKTDKEQAARFAALATLQGSKLLETYLDIFCTKSREKTKERIATKTIEKAEPDLCQRLTEERDRVWTLVLRKRAIEARDRSVALFTVAQAVIARFRAEKNRRGLLDYDDLIDKTLDLLKDDRAAWVHYKLDRGIRSRPDRRGAGHQPQAMGDREIAGRRILRRRRRARAATHDLRRRRREAVDLLVPGRGAARIRRDAACISSRHTGEPASISSPPSSNTRSAPERTCWARSIRCLRVRKPSPGSAPIQFPPFTRRCRMRRPGWWKSGSWNNPTNWKRSRAGRRPSISRARPAAWSSLRAASPARSRRWQRQGRRPKRRADPGAAARRAIRGDHPRAEEARTSRSPAPIAWCSPNTSR